MNPNLIAEVKIKIPVPIGKVWNALINPMLIKQYLFGTDVITTWEKGSQITWRGVWQGKSYEDKGVIVEIIPESRLVTTYWSSMSGLPDKPENYNKVTYELNPINGSTQLTLTQDNIATEEAKKHSEQNWQLVLNGLKILLEK